MINILFIPRLKLIDNQYVSLSKMLKINKENKNEIQTILFDLLDLSNEAYKNIPIKSLILSYGIRKGKIISEFTSLQASAGVAKQVEGVAEKVIKYHTFYRNKLPIGLTPKDYGKVLLHVNNIYVLSLNKNISINLIVDKEGDFTVNKIDYIKNGNILFQWKDKIIDKEEKIIIRYIGKSTIYFKDGEITLSKIERKTIGMTNKIIPKNDKRNNRFITMDLETLIINNIHIPYLLCWYDGYRTHSYFINNFKVSQFEDNILDMVKRAMKDINRKKYKGYIIYLHNFAKFDGYFLLKYLAQIGDTNPTIHKGRIISTKFSSSGCAAATAKGSKYQLTFMDSLLMLPSSLRKLCKSFNVETVKTIFPFKLDDINYKGPVPDIKFFDNISPEEYKEYRFTYKKIWDFKEEAIKYCSIDCIALYQILNKFNQLIFDQFKINIVKYPTLSSLAFAIFRTHFLVVASFASQKKMIYLKVFLIC